MTINEVVDESRKRMDKSLHAFEGELGKVRTGRASTGIVEHIKADYYGTLTPITQLATVSVPEAKMIVIQPWDVSAIAAIEKAIRTSDLGINPINDGKVIRLAVPPLTQERRKDLVKNIEKVAEEYRVSIRQVRKDINQLIKDEEKEKKVTEDESKKAQAKVQEQTDSYIKKINEALAKKEKEILEF